MSEKGEKYLYKVVQTENGARRFQFKYDERKNIVVAKPCEKVKKFSRKIKKKK
jgi:hypothetical protein|tara:strand:- start:105 stop:263 length:159 start_codon:yes stop_codon:yes gene_type:complete